MSPYLSPVMWGPVPWEWTVGRGPVRVALHHLFKDCPQPHYAGDLNSTDVVSGECGPCYHREWPTVYPEGSYPHRFWWPVSSPGDPDMSAKILLTSPTNPC